MPEKLRTCVKCGAPLDQPATGPAPGLLRPTRSSASSAAYRLSRSRRPARPFLDLVLLRLLDILAALFLASHCVPPSAFVRIVTRAGAGPYAAEERRRRPIPFPQDSAGIMAERLEGVKAPASSGTLPAPARQPCALAAPWVISTAGLEAYLATPRQPGLKPRTKKAG
jgi:hypothetical protein